MQEIEYDEYGNMTKNTDPTFQTLTFAGGLWDSDTKFIRFGARDYDPTVGRWTTKDPIGFAGGTTNLYEYTYSSPMSFTDQNGKVPLYIWPIATAFAGAGGAFAGTLMGGGSLNDAATASVDGFIGGALAGTIAVAGGVTATATVIGTGVGFLYTATTSIGAVPSPNPVSNIKKGINTLTGPTCESAVHKGP